MTRSRKTLFFPSVLVTAATVVLVAACGGGDSPAPAPAPAPVPTPAPPPPPTYTGVSVTVIDGAIRGAQVCFDLNRNGACDAGEPGGVTDASGKVTIQVPNDSVGKFPVLAIVGTDAVDADLGPIAAPFTLTAPADKAAVISPLTTAAQHLAEANGLSSAAAEQQLQGLTGLSVSMFEDYTQKRTTVSESVNAGLVATVIALTLQGQYKALQGAVGKNDATGAPISKADVERIVRDAVVAALPDMTASVAQPALQAACKDGPAAACKAQLQSRADDVVANSGLDEAAVVALVPITKNPPQPEGGTPAAGASFRWLNYGGSPSADWYYHTSLASAVENTPVNGVVKYRQPRRELTTAFGFREWDYSRDYNRRNEAHWNGSAWAACPDATFQHSTTVRDANGRSVYDYCDGREKGVSQRSTENIAGKTLAEVVKRIRSFPSEYGGQPYSRWGDPLVGTAWTDAQLDGFFGAAVFPANAQLQFQSSASTATATSYDVQSANRIFLYSPAIAAGGDARTGTPACATPPATADVLAARLDDLLVLKGVPCQFNPVPANANYLASGTPNDWYGNSTISLGKVGTEPTGIPGPVVPAPHFTTNVLLRVAFTGDAVDRKVSYYTCKERRSSPSTRNCTAIGTGTYEIAQLGDARVMTFNGLPLDTAALTYQRIFVERNGAVYFGYRNKAQTFKPQIRLNLEAANAVLQKLGFSPIVP